jgi:hypothetical protein
MSSMDSSFLLDPTPSWYAMIIDPAMGAQPSHVPHESFSSLADVHAETFHRYS